jgi:acyl-CoA synthetase (NDP forming)
VMSSGFSEAGEAGQRLEEETIAAARRCGVRFLGPNAFGFANPFARTVVTFSSYADHRIEGGPLAIVSQSGAFATGVAALARARGLGVGYFMSTGNEADLSLPEAMSAVLEDERIRAVGGYIEGLRDGPALLAVAERALELGKPLVLAKVGRSAEGARAAASHTAALAVSDAVFDGVARQHGILRARNEELLLDTLQALTCCGAIDGTRIGIITGSGGAGVMMTDRASELGLQVPPLAPNTRERLADAAPGFASVANPVDASAQIFRDSRMLRDVVLSVLADPAVDVGVVWTQMMEDRMDSLVATFAEIKAANPKPFVVAWLAAPPGAIAGLQAHGIAAFRSGEAAIDALEMAMRYGRIRRQRREAVAPPPMAALVVPAEPGLLPAKQGAELLRSAGVELSRFEFCRDAAQAVSAAQRLGFPVALKIESPDIAHKTEVGGLRLNLPDAAAVERAFGEMNAEVARLAPAARIEGVLVQEMVEADLEVMVGLQRDPTFGCVVIVSAGGTLVEVMADAAIRRAPVSAVQALEMLDELRMRPMFDGVRGRPPVDRPKLAALIAAVSRLGAALGDQLEELDLNPVRVSGGRAVAVDWLLRLR